MSERQRFIWPSIWEDEDFAALCPESRILFIALFSIADDEGRLLANPKHLKSEAFRFDDNMTSEHVLELRNEITSKMHSVLLYSSEGKEYIALLKWKVYQKPKYPRPSRYPAPPLQLPDNVSSNVETCASNTGSSVESEGSNSVSDVESTGVNTDSNVASEGSNPGAMGWVGLGRDGMGRSTPPQDTTYPSSGAAGPLGSAAHGQPNANPVGALIDRWRSESALPQDTAKDPQWLAGLWRNYGKDRLGLQSLLDAIGDVAISHATEPLEDPRKYLAATLRNRYSEAVEEARRIAEAEDRQRQTAERVRRESQRTDAPAEVQEQGRQIVEDLRARIEAQQAAQPKVKDPIEAHMAEVGEEVPF